MVPKSARDEGVGLRVGVGALVLKERKFPLMSGAKNTLLGLHLQADGLMEDA